MIGEADADGKLFQQCRQTRFAVSQRQFRDASFSVCAIERQRRQPDQYREQQKHGNNKKRSSKPWTEPSRSAR